MEVLWINWGHQSPCQIEFILLLVEYWVIGENTNDHCSKAMTWLTTHNHHLHHQSLSMHFWAILFVYNCRNKMRDFTSSCLIWWVMSIYAYFFSEKWFLARNCRSGSHNKNIIFLIHKKMNRRIRWILESLVDGFPYGLGNSTH